MIIEAQEIPIKTEPANTGYKYLSPLIYWHMGKSGSYKIYERNYRSPIYIDSGIDGSY